MRLKPSTPRLDASHPDAPDCAAFWAAEETAGPLVDLVSGIALAPQNSAGRAASLLGPSGLCNASQTGFAAIAPSPLRLANPITLACVVRVIGTPTVNSLFIGLTTNNTGASPFTSYDIGTDGSGNLRMSWNAAGVFNQVAASISAGSVAGTLTALVAVFGPTARTLYRNGAQITQTTGTFASPTYDATATACVGFYPTATRNSSIEFLGGGVWSSAWDEQRVRRWSADPFAHVRADDSYDDLAAAGSPAFFRRSVLRRKGVAA